MSKIRYLPLSWEQNYLAIVRSYVPEKTCSVNFICQLRQMAAEYVIFSIWVLGQPPH